MILHKIDRICASDTALTVLFLQVLRLQKNAERLVLAKRVAEAEHFSAKAAALEEEEHEAWKEKQLTEACGISSVETRSGFKQMQTSQKVP